MEAAVIHVICDRSCFVEDKARQKPPQKEKNRKINIKDRKTHLHIGRFLLPEEDSLLEEDKPRTQPVLPSEPRQAHVGPRTCKKTLVLAPAIVITFTAVLQKIPDWSDTPFETETKSRDLGLGKQKELKSHLINYLEAFIPNLVTVT